MSLTTAGPVLLIISRDSADVREWSGAILATVYRACHLYNDHRETNDVCDDDWCSLFSLTSRAYALRAIWPG